VVVEPGVFVGSLRHRRFTPVHHAFEYRTFMVLLDVDRIPALMNVSRFTGYNSRNWATFHDRDHLGDPSLPLRARLESDAARAGIALPPGPIFLLTHLRYLGYCFNPVSFYYAFDAANRLHTVLAEVNNTFGGSHRYWLQPDRQAQSAAARSFHAVAHKALYVSPFMPHDAGYRFVMTPPAERLVAHMEVSRDRQRMFDATLTLTRRPWAAAELRRCLVRHPAMTLNVTAGIHWQALKLWWKGVPVVPRRTKTGVADPVSEAVMER
jgi:DUF1365 family protein